MATDEQKRISHLAEVMRRAEVFEQDLFDQVVPLLSEVMRTSVGEDPIKLGAMAKAMIRVGLSIAYSTIGLKSDIQLRTAEDVEGIAGAIWQSVCAGAEESIAELMRSTGQAPTELLEKVRLAPSDPTQRPGLAPTNVLPEEVGEPRSIEDLLGEDPDQEFADILAGGKGLGGMAN